MAIVVYDVLSDQFNSLASKPNAWLLYLPSNGYLHTGDTLKVREVDIDGNYLGRYREGLCDIVFTPNFFYVNPVVQCYHLEPLSPVVQSYVAALWKTNVLTAHTGNLTETIAYSVLIPAGSLAANDVLRCFAPCYGTNSGNTKTVRMYFNTSASLSGATLVGQNFFSTNRGGYIAFDRYLWFQNSLSSQKVVTTAGNISSDGNNGTANSLSTLAVNFANDVYFIVSVQLATGTDTIGLVNSWGQIIR